MVFEKIWFSTYLSDSRPSSDGIFEVKKYDDFQISEIRSTDGRLAQMIFLSADLRYF